MHRQTLAFSAALASASPLRPLLQRARPAHAEDSKDGQAGPICYDCVRGAKRVFCGGEHTLIRDADSLEVFQLGACGLGFKHDDAEAASKPSNYLRKVSLPGPAAGVFPGYYHNVFRLNGGRCYSYGCGRQAPNDGQLCNGSVTEDTEPVQTQLQFADAALGGHHSVFRTRRGEVHACGAGWQGQMGNDSLRYTNPQHAKVTGLPDQVRAVSGGYYHNAALTQDGKCYVWGCNEQCQLGAQTTGDQVKKPRELRALTGDALPKGRIAAFDGGYAHSVVLLEDGRVFALGNHTDGQRGLDPDIDEPALVNEVSDLPGPAQAIAVGNHHTLILVKGVIYAFGSDEYGQVSGRRPSGDEEDDRRLHKPQAVLGLPDAKADPVIHVSAGICHSGAQTASGRVFLWGCGGNGQTGLGPAPDGAAITEVDISDLARRCKAKQFSMV
eukprot:TRINITY_DN21904_c0_g1_i1.p1 TRINITY_DN21904_c0_g1~~TRINITY_DN21904_c0_g1_i1.p1  ORF type:complete len:440 (+),score=55.13 TRINITY_DN21904_c0_g1_i1:78-1397(+)